MSLATKWRINGVELTWKETLLAMCNNYGTFCGRWHSNAFWADTKTYIPDMTEEQAQKKIQDIENEADASLGYWQAYQ